MSDEEYVSILVPKSRVMDIYAFLSQDTTDGPEPPAPSDEPATDADLIRRAYEESPDAMREFLELLAANPDEWLSIEDAREALHMKAKYQLPGVLGAFQRRWQRQYGQAGRGPFVVNDADEVQRYRMPKENAMLVASLASNLDDFRAAMVDDADAVSVLDAGLAWMRRHDGKESFGTGRSGPMYLRVPARDGELVKALSFNTSGDVGVLYIHLRKKPPFNVEDELRDLTNRLNEIGSISIPLDREKAFNVKLEFLRSPDVQAEFFRVFDDVAKRLAEPSS